MLKGSGKKRKAEATLDAERTLYGSFVNAANAVSQLYTAAVQTNKRSQEDGARQALERVVSFVLGQYGNAPTVPTAVLVEFLRHELQNVQGTPVQLPVAFPVHVAPPGQELSDEEETMAAEQPGIKRTPSRRSQAQTLPTLYAQQMQQQQHDAQQQQQQQQQQVPQQQAGHGPPGFLHHPFAGPGHFR